MVLQVLFEDMFCRCMHLAVPDSKHRMRSNTQATMIASRPLPLILLAFSISRVCTGWTFGQQGTKVSESSQSKLHNYLSSLDTISNIETLEDRQVTVVARDEWSDFVAALVAGLKLNNDAIARDELIRKLERAPSMAVKDRLLYKEHVFDVNVGRTRGGSQHLSCIKFAVTKMGTDIVLVYSKFGKKWTEQRGSGPRVEIMSNFLEAAAEEQLCKAVTGSQFQGAIPEEQLCKDSTLASPPAPPVTGNVPSAKPAGPDPSAGVKDYLASLDGKFEFTQDHEVNHVSPTEWTDFSAQLVADLTKDGSERERRDLERKFAQVQSMKVTDTGKVFLLKSHGSQDMSCVKFAVRKSDANGTDEIVVARSSLTMRWFKQHDYDLHRAHCSSHLLKEIHNFMELRADANLQLALSNDAGGCTGAPLGSHQCPSTSIQKNWWSW